MQEKRKELLFLLATMCLPLLVQLTWLLHNTQLPIADADEQLVSSHHIYTYFAGHHWLDFLGELSRARMTQWRPTFFYLFEVPFQLISGGDLMFTTCGVTLLCTAVSCFYVYRLLRLALEPAQASLGTTILGLLPTTQWPDMYLGFSGDAFLPAIFATMYHFIRSNNLQDKRHKIYFIAAVVTAFAVRPVEAFNHLAPVMLIFLTLAWHYKQINNDQLYRIILSALLSASVLCLSGVLASGVTFNSPIFTDQGRGIVFGKITTIIVIVTSIALIYGLAKLVYTWRKNGGKLSAIESGFLSIFALSVLLYLHTVPKLVEWVYMCSLGTLGAEEKDARPHTITILASFVKNTGVIPFDLIIITAVLSFAFCLTEQQRKQLLRHPLLYLFVLIPPTLLMTLISAQYLQRKITVVMDAFLLVLLIPALARGRLFYVRNALFLLLVASQFYGTFMIATDAQTHPWQARIAGGAYPIMVTTNPNPNTTVFDFMEDVSKRNRYKLISEPIWTDTSFIVDPFILIMLANTTDNGIHFTYPFSPAYTADTLPQFLAGDEDAFLLINAFSGKMEQSPSQATALRKMSTENPDPNEKLRFDLQALYAEDKLKDMGVIKKECMIIDAINHEACLFEVRNARH